MSEEKLYAVRNDEGQYWNFEDQDGFWKLSTVLLAAFTDEKSAQSLAHDHGGHVVSLTEEPEKVVLSKEQAEIVEEAYDSNYPASYIAGSSDDEKLIMKAYVNGYTVAKEKKYLVYKALGGKHTADVQYAQAYLTSVHSKILWIITSRIDEDTDESFFQFTESEIEHYGLQDCEKEEVTDDGK